MKPLNITIDDLTLDTIVGGLHYVVGQDGEGYEPMTLLDIIVTAAVNRLLLPDGGSGVYGGLRKRIDDLRTDVIRERVAAEVEATLTEPFDRTNQYGERTGSTTTMREEIARIAAEAVKVDPRSVYGREPTPAQKVIRDEVDRALAKELADVVADEKAKVVAAVRAKAADLIAQAVKEGVGR